MALLAFGGSALAAWIALGSPVLWNAPAWPVSLNTANPVWIAAGLFLLTAAVLAMAALRPAIEIHETHLVIGRRAIPWSEIRRIDQTGWTSPLAVYLTFAGPHREMLVYPGDPESCTGLLRHLRRFAREALIDGIPYRQFWGESAPEPRQMPPPRYPLLRAEDEEEVERMFQQLKAVGRIDQRKSGDK